MSHDAFIAALGTPAESTRKRGARRRAARAAVKGAVFFDHRPMVTPRAATSLGKTANTLTPPLGKGPRGSGEGGAEAKPMRARIARLTAVAASLSPHHPARLGPSGAPLPSRLSLCGWATQEGSFAAVTRRQGASGVTVGVAGVQHCGSVWACAECATAIANERAEEVTKAVEWTRERGGSVYLATLTVRHTYADNLRKMRRAIAETWTKTINGTPWKKRRERYGIHFVRRLESTVGANGWHPHLHVLILTEKALDLGEFTPWLRARWNGAVEAHDDLGEKHVGEAPFDVDVRAVERDAKAATYLSKLGLEITDAFGAKRAKDGNTKPWGLLTDYEESMRPGSDVTEERAEWSVRKWREWTKEMHGARQLTWSRGLRAAVGLNDETPDDIIAERAALDGSVACVIPPEHSRTILSRPHVKVPMKAIVEAGGTIGDVARFLRGALGSEVASSFIRWNEPKRLEAAEAMLQNRRDVLGAELRRALFMRRWERGEVETTRPDASTAFAAMVDGWKAGDAKRRARLLRRQAREQRERDDAESWAHLLAD